MAARLSDFAGILASLLTVLAVGTADAQSVSTAAATAPKPPVPSSPPTTPPRRLNIANKPWTGDFDKLLQRRMLRVFAPFSRSLYFNDQGRERGLVDEIGGLSEALAAARKAAHLEMDAPVTVEGGREGLLDSLLLGDDASDADAVAAFNRLSTAQASRLLSEVPAELRSFVSGFAPLSEREHVAVALPYGLVIH